MSDTLKHILISLVVAGSVFGIAGAFLSEDGKVGALSGPNVITPTSFQAQTTHSSTNATNTPASLTLQSTDLNYEALLINPTVGAVTVTLPTAANLSTVAPNVGDWVDITVVNSTTTAAATITFAGNTNTTLQQASSTLVLGSQQIGILRLVRTGSAAFIGYFSQAF